MMRCQSASSISSVGDALGDAGGADEDVDAAERLEHASRSALERRRVADVRRHPQRPPPALLDLGGDLVDERLRGGRSRRRRRRRRRARARATRPMPLVPPTTTAVRPDRSNRRSSVDDAWPVAARGPRGDGRRRLAAPASGVVGRLLRLVRAGLHQVRRSSPAAPRRRRARGSPGRSAGASRRRRAGRDRWRAPPSPAAARSRAPRPSRPARRRSGCPTPPRPRDGS